MRVCIITVYNSENCGSYLQAFALKETLQRLGHMVVFYQRKRGIAPPSWSRVLKSIIIKTIEGKYKELPYFIKTHLTFRKWEKTFEVISASEEIANPCDCYFFGSDTLWNLDSEHFLYDHEVYWGAKFSGKQLFTYAVSVSNTSFETLMKHKFVMSDINNFKKISVRDNHTHEVVSKLTTINVNDVCDPTLLINIQDYNWLVCDKIRRKIQGTYLLIYVFEDHVFTHEEQQTIKTFSRKNGLKIVSLGEKRKWCDYSFHYSPDTFVTLFKYADRVITNTFHGTIFSIIYRKNFVSLAVKKIKVKELLDEFCLNSQNIKSVEQIDDILSKSVDYNLAENVINKKVRKSIQYINDCLSTCGECED